VIATETVLSQSDPRAEELRWPLQRIGPGAGRRRFSRRSRASCRRGLSAAEAGPRAPSAYVSPVPA